MCAAALLLLVIGASARPLFGATRTATAPVLTAAEIGFAQDMTVHHQQALLLAQRLDPAADQPVRRVAQEIEYSQRYEIGIMQGWLRLAQAAPTAREPMAWMASDMAGHGHHGSAATTSGTALPSIGAAMPGMAAPAELDRLSVARGLDGEILFLQLMLRHHQGGITMAQAIIEQTRTGAVLDVAREMLLTQRKEIGFLSALLVARNAEPLPFP
ncbi:hypothetical protein O3I_025215 [Nocardia brasiliensis ATCC 700358]|uniref:DUF305 domain-containing protein n=1 Tax=Nocardia brasiliensis (strain ATCC 700358 / HUJEG-1) TaxID=1133849 RepID=K0F0P2_NOCB7|nr:hypothetical protein O3I_025215 [Nocardia brasiliensis ATCC 700358]